jgi:hypothetical protein
LDLDVAGERGDRAIGDIGLYDIGSREFAGGVGEGVLDGEEGAVLDHAAEIGAGIDCLLEETFIPAHHEIAVVAVASRIAVGDDELTVLARELVCLVDDLVEQTHKSGLEARGTGASHDEVRVGDVGFVVFGSDVFSIPAGGEHKFEADAIGAVCVKIGFVGEEMTVESAFGGFGVVETVESDGFLAETCLRGLVWVAVP